MDIRRIRCWQKIRGNFSSSDALYDGGEENPLADLMSDAFFYTASNYSDAGEKVDVASCSQRLCQIRSLPAK